MNDTVLQAFVLGIVLGAAVADGLCRHDRIEYVAACALCLLIGALRAASGRE